MNGSIDPRRLESRAWQMGGGIARALMMLFVAAIPLKGFAQSCPTIPASWVYAYDNQDADGTAATASAACAAILGATADGVTIISSTVVSGSQQIPTSSSSWARCQVYFEWAYDPPTEPYWIDGPSSALLTPTTGTCPEYWVQATTPPQAETCSANCVADPINPGIGNVYFSETDVTFAGGPGTVAFQRFYNSADNSGVDGVPGWRHSYDRSISIVDQTPSTLYPGQSTVVSPQYTTPAVACTSGFAAVQGAVSAWAGATATYTSGVCVLSKSTVTIGTLPIQLYPIPQPPASPVEYDVIRDDGQTLRYTLQNGVINNPPGISIRLAVTGSGFTVTDDQDTVESYSARGNPSILLTLDVCASIGCTVRSFGKTPG